MYNTVLVDSDVIMKIYAYQVLLEEGGVFFGSRQYYALSINQFTMPKRLSRNGDRSSPDITSGSLQPLFRKITLIEPTVKELMIAAELELHAQRAGLHFHTGESQLIALLIVQNFGHLLTGDKQAICALPGLSARIDYLSKAEGRIICFEQFVLCLLKARGSENLRMRVCDCPEVDKTLAFCFACSSSARPDAEYEMGLRSNINDVRRKSDRFLICEDDLFPVSP